MQLLTLILSKTECLPKILSDFMKADIKGTTVVNCDGALSILSDHQDDAPPIFGSLRHYLTPSHEHAKLMLVVLDDFKVSEAKKIINKAVGGIDRPNTGIIYTIPLSSAEGLAN